MNLLKDLFGSLFSVGKLSIGLNKFVLAETPQDERKKNKGGD